MLQVMTTNYDTVITMFLALIIVLAISQFGSLNSFD